MPVLASSSSSSAAAASSSSSRPSSSPFLWRSSYLQTSRCSSSSTSLLNMTPSSYNSYTVCGATQIQFWDDWRFSSSRILKAIIHSRHRNAFARSSKLRHIIHSTTVRSDLGGSYEDTFSDVDKHLMDYFTYKAVRTVLVQLYEMNPTQYAWFYNFVVENKPQDSKTFLRLLVTERQELGERVMVTRLHLYNKWIKKHDHAKTYQALSDQNLELLRERLVQIVKWPSDSSEGLDQS